MISAMAEILRRSPLPQ